MQGFLEAISTTDLLKLIRSVGIDVQDDMDREACCQAILEADKVPQVLAGALKHPDAKVRVNAAESIGEVGDAYGKTYLQACMTDKSGEVRSAVLKSLQRIDARRSEDRTEIEVENSDLPDEYARQLVLDAATRLGAEFTPAHNGLMLHLAVGNGKTQYVQVIFGKKDDESDPFINFLSVCGKPGAAALESIMKWNGRLNCGCVALRKVGAEEVLVLGASQPLATADYEEVEKMILDVARRGNTLKQFLRAGC